MTVKTPAELKQLFETRDVPTQQDFVDLIDSFLHAMGGNFPDPLPAVSGAQLTNIGAALPDPLPVRDGSQLTNISPAVFIDVSGMGAPSYATATTFVLNGDWRAEFKAGRRLKLTITGSPFYTHCSIDATYATGVTTVTVANSMPGAGLTACQVSIIRPTADGGAVALKTLGVTGFGESVCVAADAAAAQALLAAAGETAFTSGLGLTLLNNVRLVPSVAGNIITIALKGNDGNNPSAANPVKIGFRSATATDGGAVVRTIAAALSMTVDQGATLGFANAQTADIYVYAIDTGSGVVLGCSGVAHYTGFDETALASSTLLDAAADAAVTLYSDAAQTSKPVRFLGRFTIETGATAGDWSNAPSAVKSPFARPLALGEEQSWQDMSGSRATNTVYQNLTGRPIVVNVAGGTSDPTLPVLYVGAANPPTLAVATASDIATNESGVRFLTAVIPPRHYYKTTGFDVSITLWTELML